MNDFLASLIIFLMVLSPILFLAGLIVLIVSKEKRRLGLYMIVASAMLFVIGFGACVASI